MILNYLKVFFKAEILPLFMLVLLGLSSHDTRMQEVNSIFKTDEEKVFFSLFSSILQLISDVYF